MGTKFDLCEVVVIFKSFCNSSPQLKNCGYAHHRRLCNATGEKKMLYHTFERNFVFSKTVKNSSACPTLTTLFSWRFLRWCHLTVLKLNLINTNIL